ncbi:MAG: DUF4432 domain-containing protein [Rhodopirellula sp. TMED11]|nr:MAG: DUF4432 domain-containing protein [Rhodopirellula sp. TMED11]
MAKNRTARSLDDRLKSVSWDADSPLTMSVETALGTIETRHGRFVGGRADGVEIVQIDTGAVVVHILPSRGMGIWSLESGGLHYGWMSPVDGPVHPSLVPIHDPNGLGWLEGFDELLVRCGLESNGAPEHDANGRLIYPLHGRIGNLAADSLEIEFDEVSGRLELIGQVKESRLFFSNFRLTSRIRFHAGSPDVEILDEVTNESSTEKSMQLLYHINVGAPLLEKGAKLHMAVDEIAPRDSHAATEIDRWDAYDGPESGYSERVYFARLRGNEMQQSTVMLTNQAASQGLSVTFGLRNLDRFIIWKNTGDLADGYVTGLEPATNFPNARSYEESQGRVISLRPDQTVSFRVALQPLQNAAAVAETAAKIEEIAGDEPAKIHDTPRPGWTPSA